MEIARDQAAPSSRASSSSSPGSADPPTAPPEPADALLVSSIAVHLLFHVGNDWENARAQVAAELEGKLLRLEQYAKSRDFKDRFGRRIGVLRLQSAVTPPSVVAHLLDERGVELQLVGERAERAQTPCSYCQRTDFAPDRAAMTGEGWACPSCFRAWSLLENPQLDARPKAPLFMRVPKRVLFAALFVLVALGLAGAYYELTRLNRMNRIIKFHVGSTE